LALHEGDTLLPKATQQPLRGHRDFAHWHLDTHSGAVTSRHFICGQAHQARHRGGPPQIWFFVIKHLDHGLHVHTSVRLKGKFAQPLERERAPRSDPLARLRHERIPNGAGNRRRRLLRLFARPNFDDKALRPQSPRGHQSNDASSKDYYIRPIP
jgi:hypothetical protein